MILLWYSIALRYLGAHLHKSAEKGILLTVTTASYSVIENCNYVFPSAHRDGSVLVCSETSWIIVPGPICLWGSFCIQANDDLIFKLVSEFLPVMLKATVYLFKESSAEVKQVIHRDSPITFPKLPFIKHVPSHEPWIISFLSTLLFPLNLSKTLLDSTGTVLTDSPHTFSTFPAEKHKTFKIYIWSDNRAQCLN